MPYIAHDTNVIYAAADTAAAALAEAEKSFRNRLPTEDIDEALKSLEVHEATTALVNDSNSWVKWAYLKNGVACTPWLIPFTQVSLYVVTGLCGGAGEIGPSRL